MEMCPSCGKRMIYANHVCMGDMPVIQTVPTFTPHTYACEGCGTEYPPNSTHECAYVKGLRSAMYGKEKTVDEKHTENEMRIIALQEAVKYANGGMTTSVVLRDADSFFKFLMGESQ